MSGKIIKIQCEDAPRAIGPYSQAVSAGNLVFVSGQIPLDVVTGDIFKGDIKEQTAVVIGNIEKILASSALKLDNVVKTDVFLADMSDFPAMNEIYGAKFNGDVLPARCVIQAARLPRDARIEISCIACRE